MKIITIQNGFTLNYLMLSRTKMKSMCFAGEFFTSQMSFRTAA